MIEVLAAVVFAFHLVCMNLASAAPLLASRLDWRSQRGDETIRQMSVWLTGLGPLSLLVGAVAGVALGALVWEAAFRDALNAVHSRIFYGAWELLFSLALMIGQYYWTRATAGRSIAGCAIRMLLALLASTNLLYHFPLLFSVVRRLTAEGAPASPLSSAEFRAEMLTPPAIALAVHFLLASFAVAGLAVAWKAAVLHEKNEGKPRRSAKRLTTWGGRIALTATILQIPVGTWVLFQFPTPTQNLLLGGDLRLGCLFGAAVGVAMILLHQLAAVAIGDVARKTVMIATGLMGLVVLLMAAVLRSLA